MYCGTWIRTCPTADLADEAEQLMNASNPPPNSVTRTGPAADGSYVVTGVYPDCPPGTTHIMNGPAAAATAATVVPATPPARLAPLAAGVLPDFAAGGLALAQTDIDQAVAELDGVEPELLWALFAKETPYLAGYMPDRRPVILYERHIFSHWSQGRFDVIHPDISGPRYGAGEYGTYAHQYARLSEAMLLDPDAALKSVSWGIGQTLGEVYGEIGYPDVQAMVSDLVLSERAQVHAAVKEILSKRIAGALKALDLDTFAKKYNGPAYGQYATLLRQDYDRYKATGVPNTDVRAAQLYLQYLGYAPGTADGVLGNNTANALRAFQLKTGLPQSGTNDTTTMTALISRLFKGCPAPPLIG